MGENSRTLKLHKQATLGFTCLFRGASWKCITAILKHSNFPPLFRQLPASVKGSSLPCAPPQVEHPNCHRDECSEHPSPYGGQRKSHRKNVYRNDFPNTKGSKELLVDPVHGKEMQTNPQIYLKDTLVKELLE